MYDSIEDDLRVIKYYRLHFFLLPMADELAQYNEIYSKYFGTPVMDRPFYAKWVRSVGGATTTTVRSAQGFENYILNCEEYKSYLYNRYRVVYDNFIGTSDNLRKSFNEFMTSHGGKVGRIMLDDAVIKNYIKKLPEFAEKYTEVISTLYRMVNKEAIPENLLELYLNNFRESDNYEIEQLNEDILKGCVPSVGKVMGSNVLLEIKDVWQSIHSDAPTSSQINELLTQLGNSRFMLQTLVQQFSLFRNSRIDAIQASFVKEFEREISVPEFLKLYAGISKNTTTTVDIDYGVLRAQHTEHFNAVKTLYTRFIDEPIPEIDFIKRYIYVIDDPEYKQIIIAELVGSKSYEVRMKETIRKVYQSLFGNHVEEDDEAYMFEQLKNKSIDLANQEVSTVVTALKEETDRYIQNLQLHYDTILKRSPDILECRLYKEIYRQDHDMPKTELRIKEDLYTSLEYHEILKQKIRASFKSTFSKDPLPSQVYSMLNATLRSPDIMRDDALLDKFVSSYQT